MKLKFTFVAIAEKGDVLDIFSFHDILPSCLDMPA